MSRRLPCNYPAQWDTLFVGDCAEHLKPGECPVISGFQATFGGGAYQSPPIAILSGDIGNGTGFFGYAKLNNVGYITGLNIISSGWHFTKSPIIIFSGKFRSGVRGSDHNYDCSGKPWNDPRCMCSGLGAIYGYPIYQNNTLVPPQCSELYDTIDWVTFVNNDILPICADNIQSVAKTTNFGRCLLPALSGHCVTSWTSGWGNGDCSNGTWGKTANYCYEKGSSAPFGRCAGNWYDGGATTSCGPEIKQKWDKTEEYLDFGQCKKRGFKNVVAYKSWHGEPPLTLKYPCTDSDCANNVGNYTAKYLEAQGNWTYTMTYSNPPAPAEGSANGSISMSTRVGRTDGRVTATQNYSYSSHNWLDSLEVGSLLGFDRCHQSVFGYNGTNTPDSEHPLGPWNYCTGAQSDHSWNSDCVSTTYSISDTSYSFTQTITRREFVEACNFDGTCITEHDYTFHSVETVNVSLGEAYSYTQLNTDTDALLDTWNLLDDLQYPWKVADSELLMPKVSYCEAAPTSPLIGLQAIVAADCEHNQTICNYTYSQYGGTITWDDCNIRPDWPVDNNFQGSSRPEFTMSCSSNFANRCVANCNNDGRIMGKPAELGHFGTIDFTHENIEDLCCSCTCDTFSNALDRSFGAQSPLYHATAWPNAKELRLLYFGAFQSINDHSDIGYICNSNSSVSVPLIPDDTLVKTKYAEIIQMDKPSLNYRLPCGIGSSGDVSLINNADSLSLSLASILYKVSCIANCACGHPTGAPMECYACTGEGIFQQRWGYLGDRAYACGNTIDIASGSATISGITLQLSSPFSGSSGDYINAYIILESGTVPKPGVYPLQKILSTTGLYLSGNFISSNHVSGWLDFPNTNDWFDSRPKGDFVVRHWNYPTFAGTTPTSNNVDGWLLAPGATFDTTPYCLSWTSCDPSIVVITNSAGIETKDNKNRNVQVIEIPALVPQICGSRMHYIPQQWMTDPLWLAPSEPCCLVSGIDQTSCNAPDDEDFLASTVVHLWEEDDGSCVYDINEVQYGWDGVNFIKHHKYPMRPWVEARMSVPTGEPYSIPTNTCSAPTSIMFTEKACFTLSELEALPRSKYNFLGQYYHANLCAICTPPLVGTTYWGTYAPWLVATKQQACLDEAYPPTQNPISSI